MPALASAIYGHLSEADIRDLLLYCVSDRWWWWQNPILFKPHLSRVGGILRSLRDDSGERLGDFSMMFDVSEAPLDRVRRACNNAPEPLHAPLFSFMLVWASRTCYCANDREQSYRACVEAARELKNLLCFRL